MFLSYVPWGWLFSWISLSGGRISGCTCRGVRSSKCRVFAIGCFAQVVSGELPSCPALSHSSSSFSARMLPLEEVKFSHLWVVSCLKQQIVGLLSANFVFLQCSVWISLLASGGEVSSSWKTILTQPFFLRARSACLGIFGKQTLDEVLGAIFESSFQCKWGMTRHIKNPWPSRSWTCAVDLNLFLEV